MGGDNLMNVLSISEKMALMKVEVLDLRNADYQRIEDIANVKGIVQELKAPSTIKMNTRDLARIVYNTHLRLLEKGKNLFCLIDTDTLCAIVNEVQARNKAVWKDAKEEVKLEIFQEAGIEDDSALPDEERIKRLKSKIAVLEEENHSLKLSKILIVPSENNYKAKDEYSRLVYKINNLMAKVDVAERKSTQAEMLNAELKSNIVRLHELLRKCMDYDWLKKVEEN